MQKYFLGLDASTQSMTACIINAQTPDKIITKSINFERDLPHYGTSAGAVTSGANRLEVWSYPEMWAEALDMLLDSLSKDFDLSKITAISGSGQQHASVWVGNTNFFKDLANVEKGKLGQAVKENLSRPRAPIWMDASTALECAEISKSVGGEAYVLETTGSVMTERFTGSQIRKISKNEKEIYARTKRIHLNSSFICSILSGVDAPIDLGDGAGMNLLNLQNYQWDKKMLSATADDLIGKLPNVKNCKTIVGNVSEYFSKNYGFSKDAKVCIFTGDNPSSLVGTGVSKVGNAAISLGTSDTFFCANSFYQPADNAHIFGNPSGGFMNLICFRNGSLAREKFKNELGVDWKFFDETAFENYSPLDDEKFILPFCFDEISPRINSSCAKFIGIKKEDCPKNEAVRLFIEGQFLNMFLQAKKMKASPSKIVLTGGAAKSEGIAQTIADIFDAPVYNLNSAQNSAALGAALRAAQIAGEIPLADLENNFCEHVLFKNPRKASAEIYKIKAEKFEKILESLLEKLD